MVRLLELGHAEEVEVQARQGEWFCARAWARVLGEQGRQAEALAVLAPYVESEWWPAVEAQAELLVEWGRPDEAIELVRRHARTGGRPLEFLGRLLARQGRGVEAFTLLSAGVEDAGLAAAMVEVAGVAGREEEAAALLAARIPAGHWCDGPWCCRGLHPGTALDLLATVRERQGRIDEAIALLGAEQPVDEGRLSELLARHGRFEDLRAHAAADPDGPAAWRLAGVLEERGDVAGAVAVYRAAGESRDAALGHAQLLARHGRLAEAIAVMRALVESYGGAEDWIVSALCALYVDHGRPQDGLALLDDMTAHHENAEDWELFSLRLRLLAGCGLLDEAIELALAYPDDDPPSAVQEIAELLADQGRFEEAAALLRPHADDPSCRRRLAGQLIELGCVQDAVALLRQGRTTRVVRPDLYRLFHP
ncbi:tetratricopeptide repeat protein [Kitasatospora sp. NPDC004615]|uniref:tetratricopeptide repeat protein n=1 Tax=unclassified Kitasatospora TaxID=2633591 RepID=UPI00369F3A0F